MQNTDIPKILIVDDKPENLYTLRKLLAPLALDVVEANSGFVAMELALKNDFCVAIVDVQMPEMDGYELVEFLRNNPYTRGLPVIFVSAIFSDEYHHQRGYEAGAVDFMSKPFNPDILLSKIRIFVELYQQRLALQSANAQLAATNAVKDKFFSIVAHDLRAPFNPLIGMSRYFADVADGAPYANIRARGKSLYQAAAGIYDLLENLLQWSRLQRGRMEYAPATLDLPAVVASNIQLLATVAANKSITMVSALPPALPIYADRNMADAIIRNLISNALKFTPAGGQVTITAQPAATDTPKCVEITVRDTGVGISPDDQAKLFKLEVHHSTPGTSAETGTGLGLILCQEMVQQHNGRIWIESQVDAGTAVKFTLPLAEAQTVDWSVAPGVREAGTKQTPAEMPATALPTPPPLADLQAVYALIKLGNMRRINEWSAALAVRDETYRPFVERVQELARGFQKKQLLALMEEYLSRKQADTSSETELAVKG